MKGKLLMGLASAVVLIGSVTVMPASAHHAFSAEFDAQQPIKATGVVTKFELTNPHSWLYIDVKQPDGTVVNWGFEFGAPFSLKEKGITKASLPAGSEVTIEGFRAKSGQNFGYAVTTIFSDGRSIKTGGAQDAPDAQPAAPAAQPAAPGA